jgi:hypothetical protein
MCRDKQGLSGLSYVELGLTYPQRHLGCAKYGYNQNL